MSATVPEIVFSGIGGAVVAEVVRSLLDWLPSSRQRAREKASRVAEFATALAEFLRRMIVEFEKVPPVAPRDAGHAFVESSSVFSLFDYPELTSTLKAEVVRLAREAQMVDRGLYFELAADAERLKKWIRDAQRTAGDLDGAAQKIRTRTDRR
jgi:hypothetical protein